MNDTDATATKGDIQTILNVMRRIENKVDNLDDNLNQVKRDVNTIAKTLDINEIATQQHHNDHVSALTSL